MDIKMTTETKIQLSAKEVEQIVKSHLQEKGFNVSGYKAIVKTVYTEHGEYGEEVFSGLEIVANRKEEVHKL